MFNDGFYPTPRSVAHMMLEKVARSARNFLEPSAGKGDLADVIKSSFHNARVDCLEASPDLAAILVGKGYPVMGYDWLDYAGISYYDAIVMNPPFANGDAHLLRAWEFLHNGEIVCLLNAETIRNPHTAERRRLAAVIAANGSVEFLGDCFKDAQRRTGVDVALVHLKKDSEDDSVDLWARRGAERDAQVTEERESSLAIIDRLGNMQHFYDVANEHMLQAFAHLRKAALYMKANDITFDHQNGLEKIVPLALGNVNEARAEFLRVHRRRAWMSVMEKTEFRKLLDRKQTESFIRDVERDGNIPFTKENIRGTLENVFLARGRLFETSVANVFDALTAHFPGNTTYKEGWKSNDAYKVNRKLVFPYGVTYDRRFSHRPWGFAYSRMDIYNDVDRVLSVLAGKDFDKCLTIGEAIRKGFEAYDCDGNRVRSDFFDIRFFKKGTVHLEFRDPLLWQAFNVTAAKGKMWLGQDVARREAA